MLRRKEKEAIHDFNWVEVFFSLFSMLKGLNQNRWSIIKRCCIFYVKKLKPKQVVYNKKVFPSGEKIIFKYEIRNIFILHILTLREKLIVKTLFIEPKSGYCIHSWFPSWLYFPKQKAHWSLSTSESSCPQTIKFLLLAHHYVEKSFSSLGR